MDLKMDAIEQFDKPLSKYWFRLTRMKSGRFYFQQREIPQQGYATFSGLQLILGRGETLDQCNVIFTNERLFMTRNLDGWALDRQFIHTIENCPGGLFKSSMKVQIQLKDPETKLQPSQFELRFSEEDVKQSFLNIQKIVDLCQACKEDRLEDFQNLLQGNLTLVNLPIDMTRNTLLIMACAQNKSRIAQFLLTIHGIDINKTTEVKVMRDDKETKEVYGALYYACINNMTDVVETLLSFKTINVNILYTNEHSALQYAIRMDAKSKNSYAKIISMLILHPETKWVIASNKKQYTIPTQWIFHTSTDTQKAILRYSPKNKLPVGFKDRLETLIQEKEKEKEKEEKTESSKPLVRLNSTSTLATEDLESASKISRSQSSQSISSKLGDVDTFAEEVNQWKALLASLKLPSNLELSFVILNILKFEDDINIADSLKFYQTIALAAKQKKSWMLWKNQISAKSLPELLNGKDFESFKTLVLAEIEEKYAKGVADEETFKAVYQLKAQVKSLFLSSKEFVNEINQWKALLKHLELSPTLQLTFVILNILTLEDYISNFPETFNVLARQRKLWMLWKDEILTSIEKALPEPLNGEDFKSIKIFMLAAIKEIHANYLENTMDAKFFEDLDKLKSRVERLALSSKKNETDCPNTESFVAEINIDSDILQAKNQTEDLVLSEQNKPSLKLTAGPTSSSGIQISFPLPEDKTSHVFMSHAWAEDEEGRDNHLRVKYLNDILKKRGIVTWFDDDRIRQDTIHKPLPEPLNGEDFKSIKTLMLAEIKEIRANYLDNTVDAKFFTDLDQLESLVERLALSSKKTETDCTNANSFVAEIVKNQTEDLVLSEQYKPSFEVTAGPASAPAIQNPFPLPPNKTSHVFISHAWAEDEEGRDNHHRVKYLNDILKKRGIVTWFDDDRIRQDKNVRTTLTNALYSTCCVLICITRKYEEKINKGDKRDNCLFEFNVATHDDELSNAIMTAVMEPSMLNVGTWKRGRLKAELGDVLYTDLSEDLADINFTENCEAIAENIITTLNLT